MGYSMVHVDDLPHEGPGGAVRFDPQTTRVPIAGPDGLTMVAVGARRGNYEPRGSF